MEILAAGFGDVLGQWVWPIIQFAIGLGLVIFVHELGHFLAAKWAGIKVEEFSLGFGKRMLGFRRGETDYRVNLLPLGGYVKMMGQDDFKPETEEPTDARSWGRTPVYKRLIVLAAGVTMNVIFAALVFVMVYLVGIRFVAPIIGGVLPDFPAATVPLPPDLAEAMGKDKAVGLAPGDRVLAIDGTRTRTYDQIFMAAALSGRGQRFRFTIARTIDGQEVIFDVDLQPKPMEDSAEGERYAFGIQPAPSTTIEQPTPIGYAGTERFQPGDRIVAANGVPINHSWDIEPVLEPLTGGPLDVVVSRRGEDVTVPLQTFLYSKGKDLLLSILGMAPRVVVGNVDPHSPAGKAGLKVGDIITDYADLGTPSHAELLVLNEQLRGKEIGISVLRNGQLLNLKIVPRQREGRALIGIAPLPEQDVAYVAQVTRNSPADKAGIEAGAVITAVNGTPATAWWDLYNALKANAGKEVTLSYRLGALPREAKIGALTKEVFDPAKYVFSLPALGPGVLGVLKTPPIRGNPLEALVWSARDTRDFIARTYLTLTRLGEGRVSLKSLHGPVGIGDYYIRIAREDTAELVFFTAMLSVIVAVLNFLPLPALDGGHVLLVLIEKIRGRPLPLKVQAAIQIAGLVLIVGVFLAVTWNDISRLLPKW